MKDNMHLQANLFAQFIVAIMQGRIELSDDQRQTMMEALRRQTSIDELPRAELLGQRGRSKREDALLDHLAKLESKTDPFSRMEFDEIYKMLQDIRSKSNNKQYIRQDLEIDDGEIIQRPVRLSEALLDAVDGAAQTAGVSRQEWMRQQFIAGVTGQPPAKPSGKSTSRMAKVEGLSTSGKVHKKQMGLRLEDSLFDAVVDAAKEAGVPRNDWLRAAVVKAIEEGLDIHALLEPNPAKVSEKPDIS